MEDLKKQKEEKEKAALALRATADAAHQAVADSPGDEALQEAAENAEDAATKAQGEADAIVVPSTDPDDEDEETDDDKQDIDFEKELRELQGLGKDSTPPPTRTELEKAERALHFNAEQVRKLGGDPTKVLQPVDPPTPPAPKTPEDTSQYVTKDDRALEIAGTIARSEAEKKVIMHHYKHSIQKTGDVMKDIETAYLIANKGKIKRSFEEIRRAGFSRPAPGGGPGRPPKAEGQKPPQLSAGDQSTLKRRGYTVKPDGSWESKRYVVKFDRSKKAWVTEKK